MFLRNTLYNRFEDTVFRFPAKGRLIVRDHWAKGGCPGHGTGRRDTQGISSGEIQRYSYENCTFDM